MKTYSLSLLFVLLLGSLFLTSCSNDDSETLGFEKSVEQLPSTLGKDESMARFSEILSKATYEKKDVRDFLKSQALEKFDNGYNVFYPIVKDKKVDGDKTLKEILVSYAKDAEELNNIEAAAPLINIHIPEIADSKVATLDTQDEEIPVLYSNNLYLNGEVVDTLGEDQIPAFALFVVDESGSVQKRQN